MNEALMEAVVEALVFAGLADDDVIDPDAAVAQLEQLATILKKLGLAEREAFINFVHQLAEAEKRVSPKKRIDFLMSIPRDLGLLEGETKV